LEAENNIRENEWNNFFGVSRNTQRRNFNLEIMFSSFPKEKRQIWANLRKDGLDHLGYNIAYPITQFLFLLIILNQTQFWSMLIS
jgi:hypothetical protein